MYREREIARERVYRGTRVFESETRELRRRNSRRGYHKRGSRVAKVPQTRGSRPVFKSGRGENADADVGSASR